MSDRKSREAALEFLEYVAKKGLMAPATARARKAAVSRVLSVLDDAEAADVTNIDLDRVMTQFGHLHGKDFTPASLMTYKSRVRSALDDFTSYIENPLAFKPSVQNRERASNGNKPAVSKPRNDQQAAVPSAPPSPASNVDGPMASSILPIPIRADLTVRVQGLPFDLTAAEAKKIASVIQAMAMPT
jgi:hypothetical protein